MFVGGALLAPWLYWLVQALAGNFPKIANAPFHRYVNRSLLVLALGGLWPLLRALGATSPSHLGLTFPKNILAIITGRTFRTIFSELAKNISFQRLMFQAAVRLGKRLFAGFTLGFVSLAIVASITVLAGGRTFPDQIDAGKLFGKLLGALATAAIVSVLEEVLFRGGIFGGLKRVFDWRVAAAISSAVYALVHFLARTQHAGEVRWWSGLELLPQMLAGFGDWHVLVPGFFNLTLAGALLALAYQRTGNLYCSIGIHAGWIFWLKSYGNFSVPVAGANVWLWGSTKMIDGWFAAIVLSVMLLALFKLFARKPTDYAA